MIGVRTAGGGHFTSLTLAGSQRPATILANLPSFRYEVRSPPETRIRVVVHIRPANESDFPALLHVQQIAFGEYAGVYKVSGWTTETLESLKEDAREKHIFVAEEGGTIVGSVRFWTVAGVCVVRLLSVSPTHQRQGVGKALILEIERATIDAHKFYACTMLRTARNIQFFMNLGYRAETILPDHYDHLDLICFAKYR